MINELTPKLNDPYYNLKTKIFWILNDIHDFPICQVCGKEIKKNVISVNLGYSGKGKYCSNKCS